MKPLMIFICLSMLLLSCNTNNAGQPAKPAILPISGTWKLIKGMLIEKSDTTITDYTKNTSFIKIINDTHFAFLQHDLTKNKDSAVNFSAGGGKYDLHDSSYTEHLQYCSAPNWEGNSFPFTIHIHNDTLVQSGVEKVEGSGIDRLNIETYVRWKQ